MRNGSERKPSWSSPPPYCEVGLGLKMQQQSYSCEGGGGSGSGSPFFNNQPHVYELANVCGNMCGKSLFTTSQLQELERQKLIHKYILASIPVPPQLLLTTSPTQCNTGGLDLRFSSNGSDPEPWRCKRTDGKKWRCSRDVAPDQKYCERHAHKNRPRSRKHVENSPHNYSQKHLSNNPTTLRRSVAAAPYDQTRCMEWLMRGGKSDDTKQWEQQQLMQISRDNTTKSSEDDHDLSVYHPHFADKQQDFSSETTTTRLFIDAWGKEEEGVEGKRTDKKSWPLSLSMKTEWWGGPLGEALCLGNANTTDSTPHRYAKTSSDDANHALNFIG